jgi:beta-glucuronidase
MTPDLETYIRKATRLVNRLDPTRLRTLDIFGYPQTPPADVYQELDGLGINNYFGWYPGPNGQTEDRDLLGPFLDQMHAYYPDMALFVTEFGAEANRHGSVDQKGTYEFQQDFLRDHIETYMSKPYINGAIAWILRDFRVRPDWEGGNPRPEPPLNQKGLVDDLNKRKPAFDDVAELYKSIRAVR